MKPQPRFNTLQDRDGSWPDITKTKVIPGHPNRKLTNIQSIHKKPRNTQKLITRETKQNMTRQKRTKRQRKTKEQGMKPGENTGCQRTVKKQMFQRLSRVTTKTDSRDAITKGRKPLSGVQDTMSDLPGEVNNRTINVKKEDLAPGSRPVQLAKGDRELPNTVRDNRTINQQQRIRRPGGQGRHRSNCNTCPHAERTSTVDKQPPADDQADRRAL